MFFHEHSLKSTPSLLFFRLLQLFGKTETTEFESEFDQKQCAKFAHYKFRQTLLFLKSRFFIDAILQKEGTREIKRKNVRNKKKDVQNKKKNIRHRQG